MFPEIINSTPTWHRQGRPEEGPRSQRAGETPGGVYTRGRQSGRTSESEGKQRSGMTLAGRIMTVKVKAMWAPPVKGEKGESEASAAWEEALRLRGWRSSS